MKLPFLAAMLIAMLGVTSSASVPARPAAATRDWSTAFAPTPQGYVIQGNPRAAVKIIEYLSFTCSHCAEFSIESQKVLKGQFIRSGSVSIEYRPIGRDLLDLGATILARCAGTAGFAGSAEEIFSRQNEWLSIGIGFMERDAKRFALDTPLGQIRAGAQSSGLVDLMRARGLTSERINACFADEKGLDQIIALGNAARKVIKGTPSFVINGTPTDIFTWDKLEPLLRAKGAH